MSMDILFSLTTTASSSRQLPVLNMVPPLTREHGKQPANSAAFRAALPCYILPFNPYTAFPSSPFPSPSLDEEIEGEKGVMNRLMPCGSIKSSLLVWKSRELICLNLSHCSAATIWMPGREELASSAVISAA